MGIRMVIIHDVVNAIKLTQSFTLNSDCFINTLLYDIVAEAY